MPSKVLVFEDDPVSRQEISTCLESRDYVVCLAQNPADFWRRLDSRCVDAVVLNLSAFGGDVLECLSRVRTHTSVPLIAIDSSQDKLDRILALELGADDYLTQPVVARELLARLRSIERRIAVARSGEQREFAFQGWQFCPDERRLRRANGTFIRLSAMESSILLALVSAPGKLLSRDRLLSLSHLDQGDVGERSVDVMIARLRQKLGAERTLIITERGSGYRFRAESPAEGSAHDERRQKPGIVAPNARSLGHNELPERAAVSD